MQKQVAGMENPLLEASAFSIGNRVAFRHDGRSVEPVAGQFVMEFEPVGAVVSAKVRPIIASDSAADLFCPGVALEEHPSTHDEAIAVYLQVLQLRAEHPAAHINLGTLYYNRQDFVCGGKALPPRGCSPIRATRWRTLISATCSTKPDASTKRSQPTGPRCSWLRPTPTRTTTWRWLIERQRQPRRALEHWKSLRHARPDGALVGPRPQPDRANSGRRQAQDGLQPTEVIVTIGPD